ncbi:MAG: hypothetical protein WCA08_08920 [Desulfoferrobacter sp.]
MKLSLGAGKLKKRWLCVSLLLLSLMPPVPVSGQTLCAQFQRMLAPLNHIRNETAAASFEFNGKRYQGCKVIFETKWALIGRDQDPQEMFYPSQNNELYLAGWRTDDRFSADGPGSTFYVIRNGNTFCTVSWNFVAYVDDGKIVEGDQVTCQIECGTDDGQSLEGSQ